MTIDNQKFMDLMNAILSAARDTVRTLDVSRKEHWPQAQTNLALAIDTLDVFLVTEATANYLKQAAEAKP